ncbi:MAG: hypothetical protein KTR27_16250 [Leptolyngbyaceae cyanobacterium MAG.088]|nr:hypothetical protein [Leptolyngbyaceae cyanobacterium MAG.088]
MSEHTHNINPEEWKFEFALNTLAYASEKVMDPNYFIEEVYHDQDGDWQLFHNGGDAGTPPKLICMGCICEGDPSILKLYDMPKGWFAYRDRVDQAWTRSPYERQDDDSD